MNSSAFTQVGAEAVGVPGGGHRALVRDLLQPGRRLA